MTFKIIPIPAFKDNYIWLMLNPANTAGIIVDPGDASPVLKKLQELNIKLTAILITHHHHDHTGGITEILKHYPIPVFGPQHEMIKDVTKLVNETSKIQLPGFPIFNIIDIPGHTSGHIAYYGNNTLFCGDTLFAAGCGRLFEGTANQMFTSLNKLANLPDTTFVYCAHEYTLANLRFAQTVEPNNTAITKRIKQCETLRTKNSPTVPATLQEEKITNPFLRCSQTEILAAAEKYSGKKLTTPVEVFTVLRAWKNVFV